MELSQQGPNEEARTPEQRYSQEAEQPIAGLSERFAQLRAEELGKPIAIGQTSATGEPATDLKYIGHILPTDGSNSWHVVMLDNGMAAVVGKQSGTAESGNEYVVHYTETNPSIFPEGTTKEEIFGKLSGIPGHEWKHGGYTYGSTRDKDPEKIAFLRNSISKATEHVAKTVKERRAVRQEIGQFAAHSLIKALSPEMRETPEDI